MTTFNVPIKVDDGDSNQRINRFELALAKAEKQSDELTAAIKRMGDGTRSLSSIMTSAFEKSIAGVTQALQREQAMLTSIRGDLQRFTQEHQTLDSMLKRNVISLNEYTAALARSRASAGMGNPMSAVSLPSAPKAGGAMGAIGGHIASMAGPAAAAGMVASAFTQELEKIGQHERTLDAAANSLLRYHWTMKDARSALSDHIALSQQLGVSVRDEIAAFDGVEGAMSTMATTKRQLMDITRNLSMVMISEDKAVENVARVMETMEFAMQRGIIEGRELKTIMKEFPPIAEMWRNALGKSNAEILDMAKSGQLGRAEIQQMIMAFEDGSAVMPKFAERQLDVKQVMESQGVTFFEAYHMVEKHRASIEDSMKPLDDYEKQLRAINATLNDVIATSANIEAKLDAADVRYVTDSFAAQHGKIMKALTDGVKQYEQAAARAAREQEAWNEQMRKMAEIEIPLRNIGDGRGHRSGIFADSQTDFSMIAQQPDPFAGRFQESIDLEQLANDIQKSNDALQGFDKAWSDLSANMEQGVMQQVQRLGDELADLFMTGEFGWRSMIDAMIKDMTRLAIQQAVMFGFKSAFPTLAGSAGLDFTVQGYSAGGPARVDTDSVFLGMRVSPNERVIVQTPGQRMRDSDAAPMSAPAPRVTIVNQHDPRALLDALDSPEGATVINNLQRRFPGAFRR